MSSNSLFNSSSRKRRGVKKPQQQQLQQILTTQRRPQRIASNRSMNSQQPRARVISTRGQEVVERGIPGFAVPRYRARLNYYDSFALSTGAGSAGTYVYSANGLYDPDITSTGHQPMSFDQLMASFEHYCVLRARATVNFKVSTTDYILSASVSLNAGSTPTTNYVALVENGLMVRTRLNGATIDGSMDTLQLPIDIGKFGSVPDLLDNPDYNGSVAANPIEQSYFHISLWNPSSLQVGTALVEVFIEYEAMFFEPRKNSSSINAALMKLIIADDKRKLLEQKS